MNQLLLSSLVLSTLFYTSTHASEIAISEREIPKLPEPQWEPKEDQLILDVLRGLVIVKEPKQIVFEGIEGKEGIDTTDFGRDFPLQVKEALTMQYLDKPFYKSDLDEVRKTIVQGFKKAGYPLVNVYIPDQEIRKGVIQVIVLNSKVSNIVVKGTRWTSEERIKGYIRLNEGDPLNEEMLLQDVNFLNRNPFRKIDVVYAPGKTPGTTDIELRAVEVRPMRLYAGGENNGLQDIGVQRWFTGFNWGNAFGLGHILSYQFTTSANFSKFLSHSASYTAPLPWYHMFLAYGGYSQIETVLPNTQNKVTGYSAQISMRYNIPLKPKAEYYHDIFFGADYKRMDNTIEFTTPGILSNSINLSQLVLGYSGSYDVFSSKFTTDLELFFSPGQWLGEQSKVSYSAFRDNANPLYGYGRLALGGEIPLPHHFVTSLTLTGQLASGCLLPSEQVGFGGYDSVRGYTQRSATADYGYILNAELRLPPFSLFRKSKQDQLLFLVFVDYGQGFNFSSPTTPLPSSEWLMGVGPGVKYHVGRYLTARADWGWKIHRNGFPGGRSRIDFSFVLSY